ncbi:hypothetical protein A5757_02920 [Mycobacterium sp. 852013-51886_SCH5428379]|uniref:HNH endonuclease signature motif containing protein n=1 Tax=Mycobacterium sp. 852013-51886_SCH5428379 TaxID=1834111 RepID=UPI0007FF6D92|nr:HNH endonuclease signature motif containing protein [Mycobacterium sp. 852013-51886_SCH5428379]OBB56007.1 hypothetical protein A5757_02920 [Mycobacterium sp. 852013-51886_SCH5428379]
MDREALQSALGRWDAARAELAAFPYESLTTTERLALVERLERSQRHDLALSHTVLAAFADDADPRMFGERSLRKVVATRLHLTEKDAGNRLRDAAQLGPRRTLTGEPLTPELEHTAAALAGGDIGAAHVGVIQKFLDSLPGWVDAVARAEAEQTLARVAVGLDAEQLGKAADQLYALIDPDGAEPNEELQQRKRYLRKGKQQRDGMTPIHGLLDPETAALLDVTIATHGGPSTDANGLADTRTEGQRHHDALTTTLRDAVAAGQGGTVNGLPATIVATTTLDALEKATGYAATAGGTRLPIRDLIQMAGHARHYLAVFDNHHKEVLYLGRAKRCATTAQRLALFARDIGCTRPGCTKAAFDCQAHHGVKPWAAGGKTNIDELTLACTPDHATLEDTGWTTRRRNGHTEWTPPPKLDTGQTRINHYHHPQRYLETEDGDDDEPD